MVQHHVTAGLPLPFPPHYQGHFWKSHKWSNLSRGISLEMTEAVVLLCGLHLRFPFLILKGCIFILLQLLFNRRARFSVQYSLYFFPKIKFLF